MADVDHIGGVVAPPADHQTGGTLQLGPVAVYHRVQAPLTHVEHLPKKKEDICIIRGLCNSGNFKIYEIRAIILGRGNRTIISYLYSEIVFIVILSFNFIKKLILFTKITISESEPKLGKKQCCGSGSVLDPYSGAFWIRIHTCKYRVK